MSARAAASARPSRLLKDPSRCFDKLSTSGSPPRFHGLFPLALSLSKGVRILFQQPARARLCCAVVAAVALLQGTPAAALDVNLWPLIEYHHAATGERALRLLGPLFSYTTGPEHSELVLRPLFALSRGPNAADNQFSVLYPLFVSRWDEQRTDYRVLGLISYTHETQRQPDLWDTRFTIFPLVFYRYSHRRGTSLSVLPFYADVPDFFGYQRVRMIAFPFYLHLEEPLIEHTWLPFPFVSWAGGTLGHGWRVFPFYGWDQEGEANRFHYVLWPFYIERESHFTRPERERQLIMFPFYSSIDSPTKRSRSFGGPFFTHTVDERQHTDTWGFPWPLWLSQRDLTSGERTGLRLAPFYEDTQFGDLHAHFVLWPLYRWSTQESEDYRHTRSDALLILYRNIEDAQPTRDHSRHLWTMFPLYRATNEDGQREFSTLALFDALLPRNPTIRLLYAPLWQVFTRAQDGAQPARWSLLWDLVSSDGTQLRYPLHFDFTQ